MCVRDRTYGCCDLVLFLIDSKIHLRYGLFVTGHIARTPNAATNLSEGFRNLHLVTQQFTLNQEVSMPKKNPNPLNTEILVTNSWSDRAVRIAQLSDEVSRVTQAIPHATDDARRALDVETRSLIERCDVLLGEMPKDLAEAQD